MFLSDSGRTVSSRDPVSSFIRNRTRSSFSVSLLFGLSIPVVPHQQRVFLPIRFPNRRVYFVSGGGQPETPVESRELLLTTLLRSVRHGTRPQTSSQHTTINYHT